MQACTQDIIDAMRQAGFEIDEEEAADILDAFVDDLEKQQGKIYSQSQENQLLERRLKIHQQAKISAAIQKRNFLINQKRAALLKQAIDNYEGSADDALLDILVGSVKNYKGGRMSVDARRQGIQNDGAGLLLAELQKNDLVGLFQSSQLDEMIYKELFDGFGTSGNAEARQIAEAIQRVQKNLLDRKNRNGANIGELASYVVRQRHDPNRLRDAGFDQWYNDIVPLLDVEKTFDGVRGGAAGRKAFLREAYNHLESGNFQKTSSVTGEDGKVDPLTAFKGPANLAKKLSGSRVLHFRDGKSSYQYANKYSGKNLINSVLDGISNDAESIALMEVLGTNPEAMLETIIRGRDDITDRGARRLRNALKELDGTTRAVGAAQKKVLGLDMTATAASVRALQNMSKLGFATISSFSDIASKATLLQRETGRSFFESYNEAILDVMRGFTDTQKREFSYYLGTGVDTFLGSVHSRFAADDQLPGMMTKAQQTYFKLNGMQFWNSAQKDGVAKILAADLAKNVGKRFDDLPVELRTTLELYDINAQELALFRGVDRQGPDGREYVFPSMVDEIDDAALDAAASVRFQRTNITPEMRQQFRDDLRTRIAAYYADSADAAVPTPGARERAIMNQGTKRGTPIGEAIRMIAQFKSFPITFVTKGLQRQYYGQKAVGRSGAIGIAQLMVGTTAMGYIANATKDILKGREPREVLTRERALKSFTEAFVAGGGAGIYGDFLFGEYNRYGQSLTQTLAGPTFGTLDDVARIYGSMMSGDIDKAGERAVNFAFRNLPGANLFYLKMGIDYLFLHGISEMMNPGYMRRLERRIERETGSEFYLPPSEFAVGS
jgi:hypothetical protein